MTRGCCCPTSDGAGKSGVSADMFSAVAYSTEYSLCHRLLGGVRQEAQSAEPVYRDRRSGHDYRLATSVQRQECYRGERSTSFGAEYRADLAPPNSSLELT